MHRRDIVCSFGALAVVVGFGVLGASVRGQEPPARKNGTIKLMVFFDGGYVVDFGKDKVVDVNAINSTDYPMKANVITNPAPTVVDLTTYEVDFLPNGSAPTPAKPLMPPYDATQTGCTPADITLPNNRLFIPNLTEIAQIMKTEVEIKPKTTLHLTGGGEVSVRRVGGCVEFRDGNDIALPNVPIRSMVSGRAGLLYEWRDIPATKIVLRRQPLGGGQAITTDLIPNRHGLIVVWMSHKEIPRNRQAVLFDTDIKIAATAYVPHDIKFGHHFDKAFKTYNDPKFRLWWLGGYDASPGIDCPTGGVP
jgi:hypothetical protein